MRLACDIYIPPDLIVKTELNFAEITVGNS